MKRTVTTQGELDEALADGAVEEIVIDSPRGVWIYLDSSGSATVSASGSATVSASGSATVRASGSATVSAYDSATVRAYGSATVSAYDSATVSAYDSATVSASKFVAVHLHSKRVTLDGGVVIDVTDLDLGQLQTWLDYTGTQAVDGKVTLYKAVNDDWTSPHGTSYEPGTEPAAPDWRDDADCGGGLHFGPSPAHAQAYHDDATRFVEVEVDAATLRPIPGGTAKAKAPSCRVVREVDVHGRPLAAREEA